MNSAIDPFSHHPELRDKIKDPLNSFFRDFDVKEILNDHPELHWVLDELHTDEQRTVSRNALLESHGDADLWVFAYGSLMWDPAFVFSEVRRAAIPDYSRRFILKDVWGGRGTLEAPGLMSALDTGEGCEGLVYRIAQEVIDNETEILWQREMVGPGYIPKFLTALVDGMPLRVLTFVADYNAKPMHPDLKLSEQIEFIATGTGILGSSLEYLQNIVSQFATLDVVDEHCTALLRDVESYLQANPAKNIGAAK